MTGDDLSRVGWREWVRLPEVTTHPVKAKVDTGARTSSLHAVDVVVVGDRVTFTVHPHQRRGDDAATLTLPLREHRRVRPSTGEAERRPVVELAVHVGHDQLHLPVTLTDRDAMGFRMLLGRTAIAGRYLVDPGASFLRGGRP